jgi:hypothetical protein
VYLLDALVEAVLIAGWALRWLRLTDRPTSQVQVPGSSAVK